MIEITLEKEYNRDPVKTIIQLNRYLFISKFINKDDIVIDVGCGKGYGPLLYANIAKKVYGVDLKIYNKFDKRNLTFIEGNIKNTDLLSLKPNNIIMNDFIEHVHKDDAESIIKKSQESLQDYGMLILGTPNKNSYKYRSKESKEQHKHEYTQEEIESLCNKYFNKTIMFSMNNKEIHIGKDNMSWFTFLVCIK